MDQPWLLGNTVLLEAKSNDSKGMAEFKDMTLSDNDEMISGFGVKADPGTGTHSIFLYGIDSGWTLSGKIFVTNLGGSRYELFAKMVDYAPVPVPAALPIIGTALASFGVAGWRQRKTA